MTSWQNVAYLMALGKVRSGRGNRSHLNYCLLCIRAPPMGSSVPSPTEPGQTPDTNVTSCIVPAQVDKNAR